MPSEGRAPLSAAQRTMIGRKGGLTTAARGNVNTKAAREARKRRFYDQVDPEGVLPAAEREKRARTAERAYMVDLQYRASRAKAERKAERNTAADGQDAERKAERETADEQHV